MSPTELGGSKTSGSWAVLLGIVGLGLAARCWQIQESLWLDELHTDWVVDNGLASVWQRAAIGNQSPLYFLFPWASRSLFGAQEWAVRLPSLVAGLVLIGLAWWVVREWSGSAAAAACAALLVSLDRNCIFYAQEARPYAFVQVAGLTHVYLFWRVQSAPTIRFRAALLLTGTCLFWLHYTSVLLLLAETTWYLWRRLTFPARSSYSVSMLLCDGGLLGFACTPSLEYLVDLMNRRADWAQFVGQAPLHEAARWLSLGTYVLLPGAAVAVQRLARRAVSGHGQTQAGSREQVPRRSQRGGELSLVVCWLLIPVTVAWTLTWFDLVRLFFVRYLVVVVVAPMIWGSLLLGRLATPASRVAAGLIVAAATVASSGMFTQWTRDGRLLADRRQDWRAATEWLKAQPGAGELPVLVRSGLLEADRLSGQPGLGRAYCLSPVTGIYDLSPVSPRMIPLPTTNAGQFSEALVEQLLGHRGVWLIVNGHRNSRAGTVQDAEQRLSAAGRSPRIAQRANFGDVEVWQIDFET